MRIVEFSNITERLWLKGFLPTPKRPKNLPKDQREIVIYDDGYGVFSTSCGYDYGDSGALHSSLIHEKMPTMRKKYDDVWRGYAKIDHWKKVVKLMSQRGKVPIKVSDYYKKRFTNYSVEYPVLLSDFDK